ncbi:MAG: PadR family transcriptional regulator [Nitrososphaerota archaeon]
MRDTRRRPIIPLAYALLGLLARAPCSGYDLIRRMEEPVGFFWHARRSQIYPELARLEDAGLVVHTVVEQQERPDKKVYEITEAGRAALAAWATEPMRIPAERDEFMLKIFSLWLANPASALALVRGYASQHAERLARYEEIRANMERNAPEELRRLDSPRFASYATLLRGIEYERGYISWCHWLIEITEADAASR